MRIVFLISVLALSACGADAPPFRPTANLGIGIGSGGVTGNCSVGGTNGSVTLSVGC